MKNIVKLNIVILVLMMSCASSEKKGEAYIGTWYTNYKPDMFLPTVFEIKRKGDLYEINRYSVKNYKMKEGSFKTYVAPLSDGYIEFGPMSKLRYIEDDNTLRWDQRIFIKLNNDKGNLEQQIKEIESLPVHTSLKK